jgi:hypothetical protein
MRSAFGLKHSYTWESGWFTSQDRTRCTLSQTRTTAPRPAASKQKRSDRKTSDTLRGFSFLLGLYSELLVNAGGYWVMPRGA